MEYDSLFEGNYWCYQKKEDEPPAHGNVPPNGDDPMHPDQRGYDLPPEDIPIGDDPLDDENEPDYQIGPDPDDQDYDDDDDDDDDQEYIIPDDHGPPPDDDLDMPGIQDPGET